MPPDEMQAALGRNAVRLGSWQLERNQVALAVEEARRRGYARKDPGLVPGTKAVSVVVPNNKHNPIAAVTVAAVRTRLRPARESEIVDLLKKLSTDIVKSLE